MSGSEVEMSGVDFPDDDDYLTDDYLSDESEREGMSLMSSPGERRRSSTRSYEGRETCEGITCCDVAKFVCFTFAAIVGALGLYTLYSMRMELSELEKHERLLEENQQTSWDQNFHPAQPTQPTRPGRDPFPSDTSPSDAAPSAAAKPELPPLDMSKILQTEAKIDELLALYASYYPASVLKKTVEPDPTVSTSAAGLEFIAKKMARSLTWEDRFIIAAMGSSVTAGHDNCAYDSYEHQMERTLKPIWDAANVHFEVRNAGQGGECGDTYYNQVYGIRSTLGDDTDVAHYSWTYFENGPGIMESREAFARWALLMKRSPAAAIFNTGDNCRNAIDSSGKLQEAYGKFGLHVVCMQQGIKTAGYPGNEWAHVGDEIHNFTRYGGIEGDVEVSDARRHSTGVVFRNWHPGPLGFQTVADTFSFYYMHALKLAVKDLKQIAQGCSNKADCIKKTAGSKYPKIPEIILNTDLPAPLYCDPAVCNRENPPGATNWEEPTFGSQDIRVAPKDNEFNPYTARYVKGQTDWKLWQPGVKQMIPAAERKYDLCQFKDQCSGLRGEAKSGFLTLRMPRMELGKVIICCSGKGDLGGKECSKNFNAFNVGFIFDNQEVEGPFNAVLGGKCIEVMKDWKSLKKPLKNKTGHLFLGIWFKDESVGDKAIVISHVFAI